MAASFKNCQQILFKLLTLPTQYLHYGLTKRITNSYLACLKTRDNHAVKVSFSSLAWSVINLSLEDWENKEEELRKERIISHYIALAEAAIKEGNVEKAEALLEKALKVCEKTRTIGITCVYDMLATIAFKKGKVSEATQLLEEAIAKFSESTSKQDRNAVVNFSLKLARLYESEGQLDLAELGFRNCVGVQKKKYLKGSHDEETTTLWINSLFWYGKFLAQRERFSEAKQCFESVYLLIPHVKSIGNEQAMVTLFNLGEMSFATGDNEGALKHLLNAVLLGKSLKSPDLPIYYNKIGLIYLYRGIYNEARRWCSNGLEASKRHQNKSIRKESEECLKEIERLHSAKTKNDDKNKTT